ncbi:MAG: S-adenosylmethionine:tRNA ribosyltransferase-isomerase [Clostridium sp.]|nr:S-adenosylmethionine:tRNA ribosyltransferase-isomerase [Prevotella sp.]MCM1429765.1 S-adenosylmethionine:tRNA ribosyltransferase-isomerase [Clostridium sp.]MCM1476065.1 S-adenosylmethionine:tRNA ribosyltransferase-isomerase [Muribaculaceae bacterium]
MSPKNIKIEDFDYPLPDERIARFPLVDRDACKLLFFNPASGIEHHIFSDISSLIAPGSLLVANETKVINARIEFHKTTGARIEVFILEPFEPADYAVAFASHTSCRWTCLIGNRKKWKSGFISKLIDLPGYTEPVELRAEISEEGEGGACIVDFSWNNPGVSFAAIVEAAGNIPIPPYLKRDSQESDSRDYQTVFSRIEGSVAAPTAGLHFTPQLLSSLSDKGVDFQKLILHVGAGTFKPVKSETIGEHPMHTESFIVSRQLIEKLISALSENRSVIAVGTTSVRTLESLPYLASIIDKGETNLHISQWMAYEKQYENLNTIEALRQLLDFMDKNGVNSISASTAIMIAPGFHWRIVSRMVTNFHQPQSTLLLLVSSFLSNGTDTTELPPWRRIYNEALASDYRFLSYGDACYLIRN